MIAGRGLQPLPRLAVLMLGMSGGWPGADGLVPAVLAQASAKPAAGPQTGAPSKTPPVPAEPTATTASYGDWVLRCQRLGGGSQQVCEVGQSMRVQGQTAPVAHLAIGRPPGQGGLRVTVLLPPSVTFPSSVRVGEAGRTGADTAKETDHGVDLTWRRCLPGGCVADGPVQEPILQSWGKADEAGRIGFQDAEGREVAVPVSFRGLGPALDALAREKS
ncbi:invasion protein [Methylobacterium sp. 2A]|nr:invasion protein [Methylobacterium sp. 2A]